MGEQTGQFLQLQVLTGSSGSSISAIDADTAYVALNNADMVFSKPLMQDQHGQNKQQLFRDLADNPTLYTFLMLTMVFVQGIQKWLLGNLHN